MGQNLTSGNVKSYFLLLGMMGCSELTEVHSLRDHMHNTLSICLKYAEVANIELYNTVYSM